MDVSKKKTDILRIIKNYQTKIMFRFLIYNQKKKSCRNSDFGTDVDFCTISDGIIKVGYPPDSCPCLCLYLCSCLCLCLCLCLCFCLCLCLSVSVYVSVSVSLFFLLSLFLFVCFFCSFFLCFFVFIRVLFAYIMCTHVKIITFCLGTRKNNIFFYVPY